MAEEKKPKIPSLEEIAGSTAKFMQSGELANQNNYAAQLQNFYSYIQSIGGNPQEIEGMYHYGQNPEKFSLDIAAAAKIDKRKNLESVESGLDIIVGKLDEESLTELAVKTGLKDKKYLTLMQAMQTKDQKSIVTLVKADYLERNKDNEYLVAWAKNARPDAWLTYSGFEIARMQQDFVNKNLYTTQEVVKDGKKEKETKYDAAKAQAFLLKSVRALKDKEKEQAYTELGQIALAIVEEAKAKKEKEAKAKPSS